MTAAVSADNPLLGPSARRAAGSARADGGSAHRSAPGLGTACQHGAEHPDRSGHRRATAQHRADRAHPGCGIGQGHRGCRCRPGPPAPPLRCRAGPGALPRAVSAARVVHDLGPGPRAGQCQAGPVSGRATPNHRVPPVRRTAITIRGAGP